MKAAESKYRRHENDVGSSEVQIARIHERIVHLAKHLEVLKCELYIVFLPF
jgi:ribosomal protein S15P/S13E